MKTIIKTMKVTMTHEGSLSDNATYCGTLAELDAVKGFVFESDEIAVNENRGLMTVIADVSFELKDDEDEACVDFEDMICDKLRDEVLQVADIEAEEFDDD